MNENYILETDIYVAIGDDEAVYDLKCYDGYATGVRTCDNENCPATIKMEYPLLAEILPYEHLVSHILTYRGLYDLRAENIHFGDVMMALGEIVNN